MRTFNAGPKPGVPRGCGRRVRMLLLLTGKSAHEMKEESG